jgi:hypothetical protein
MCGSSLDAALDVRAHRVAQIRAVELEQVERPHERLRLARAAT